MDRKGRNTGDNNTLWKTNSVQFWTHPVSYRWCFMAKTRGDNKTPWTTNSVQFWPLPVSSFLVFCSSAKTLGFTYLWMRIRIVSANVFPDFCILPRILLCILSHIRLCILPHILLWAICVSRRSGGNCSPSVFSLMEVDVQHHEDCCD